MPRFFEPGGPRFFVSITTGRDGKMHRITSEECQLVKSWDDVLKILAGFGEPNRNTSLETPDYVEIFTTPRLCPECLRRTSQAGMFEMAKSNKECLYFIERHGGDPIHK
ncbi:MAG: hypothetical protein HYT19_00365 [Candidatus Nealsonbacteria bacterium]|nr:hypothetical protein [Candidatus Nealsonbacteria bacterium]